MMPLLSVPSVVARRLRLSRFPFGRRARESRLVAMSGLFDASYHLINAADVAAAGADPIRHFCDHGWREHRRPNLYFDPA